MAKIILADGTTFSNVFENGSHLQIPQKLTKADFEGKMNTITIVHESEEGNAEEVINDATFVYFRPNDDSVGVSFRSITPQEKKAAALQKIIDDDTTSITDIQLALVELFEIIGG